MTTTLLQAVNALLKRVGEVAGDAGELTTLTDAPRQKHINRAVQMFNEAIIQLYDLVNEPLPNELAESTISLVTDTRAHTLPTDLVRIVWPLQDRTLGNYIVEHNGGYLEMQKEQPIPANFTGRPTSATIRPTDGLLYLDRIPTASENGETFTITYEKSLILVLAADTFPFRDEVFIMTNAAVAEMWTRYSHKDFDTGLWLTALAGAARLLTQSQRSDSWTPTRFNNTQMNTDPFNG